jgi:hypothetical protein
VAGAPCSGQTIPGTGDRSTRIHGEISVQQGNEGIAIDLLVVDTTDAIGIEVKSKLTPLDVEAMGKTIPATVIENVVNEGKLIGLQHRNLCSSYSSSTIWQTVKVGCFGEPI